MPTRSSTAQRVQQAPPPSTRQQKVETFAHSLQARNVLQSIVTHTQHHLISTAACQPSDLNKAALLLLPINYDEVCEERCHSYHICSYPLCSNAVSAASTAQRYRLSLSQQAVYSTDADALYCCTEHHVQSQLYRKKLSEEPLYARPIATTLLAATAQPDRYKQHNNSTASSQGLQSPLLATNSTSSNILQHVPAPTKAAASEPSVVSHTSSKVGKDSASAAQLLQPIVENAPVSSPTKPSSTVTPSSTTNALPASVSTSDLDDLYAEYKHEQRALGRDVDESMLHAAGAPVAHSVEGPAAPPAQTAGVAASAKSAQVTPVAHKNPQQESGDQSIDEYNQQAHAINHLSAQDTQQSLGPIVGLISYDETQDIVDQHITLLPVSSNSADQSANETIDLTQQLDGLGIEESKESPDESLSSVGPAFDHRQAIIENDVVADDAHTTTSSVGTVEADASDLDLDFNTELAAQPITAEDRRIMAAALSPFAVVLDLVMQYSTTNTVRFINGKDLQLRPKIAVDVQRETILQRMLLPHINTVCTTLALGHNFARQCLGFIPTLQLARPIPTSLKPQHWQLFATVLLHAITHSQTVVPAVEPSLMQRWLRRLNVTQSQLNMLVAELTNPVTASDVDAHAS